jgi:hypothetical protein
MANLLHLDIMSPSVGFSINKNKTYQSYTGLLLSFIYLVCIVLAFVAFGRDVVERKKPYVVNNNGITQESEFMFNSTNFMFSIYNASTWKGIPDYERKFVARFDVFLNYPLGYDTTVYYFSKCSEETLNDFNRTLSSPRDTYYCFTPGTTVNVRKSREDVVYQSSRLVVEYCENERHNRTDCLPIDEIKRTTQTFSMALNFYDFYANSLSYESPLNKTFYQLAVNGAVDSYSRMVITFKNIDFTTDEGWLIEKNKREVVSSVSSVNYINFATPGAKTLFSHQFLNSQWASIYKRRYIKIPEVFANIGGIVNLVAITLKLLCDFLVRPDIMETFYNQINKSHLNKNDNSIIDRKSDDKFQNTYIKPNNFTSKFINNTQGMNFQVIDVNQKNDNSVLKRLEDKSFEQISNFRKVDDTNKQVKLGLSNPDITYLNKSNNIINEEISHNKKFDNKKSINNIDSFSHAHKRMSLKLNLDKQVKRLLNFEFQNFTIAEKIFRPFLCCKSYNSKRERYEKVKEIYDKTFSVEYSANNYRKLEIMKFLLFNEDQNKIIDNLDLPELNYYLDFDFNESKKMILEENHDDMINLKLKCLLNY